MQFRRTILASFLMLILAAPLLVLSFLQLQQLYIQHGREERLEAGLLKTLLISRNDFKQLNRHEILVANKLFDVKELKVTKNGVLVTGVFDEEETAVLQHLEKTNSTGDAKDSPVFAQAFQLFQEFYFQPAAETHLIAASVIEVFQNPIPTLPTRYLQVVSPPPQVLA